MDNQSNLFLPNVQEKMCFITLTEGGLLLCPSLQLCFVTTK